MTKPLFATLITIIAITLMTSSFAAAQTGNPIRQLRQDVNQLQTDVDTLEQNQQRDNSFFDVFFDVFTDVDSFFDVFTELQTTNANQQSQIDSFFDVFTELRATDTNLQNQINALMSDPPEPNMPSDVRIFLSLTGARQGTIEGGVMEPGHEGTIEVLSYEHEIVSPRDAASGLPTGKRQHKPITLTIQIDKASPLLYNALVNNENISEWELQFWKPASDGTMQQFYTIELRNANIADIQKTRLVPPIDPEKLHEVEHVSFVYQKIIWTWVDGGITAEDDWESPVA